MDWLDTIAIGDCLKIAPTLPNSSVDLLINDPPYYKIKSEWWDRQWDTVDGYIEWFDKVCQQWYRLLKPNGSLYVFASPKMAARVEIKVGEYFNVLNRIVWPKSGESTHALKYGGDRFRQYVQKSERIIFAEHNGADRLSSFAKVMAENMQRLALSQSDLSSLELSRRGNRTGWIHNKLKGIQIPTLEQWVKLCGAFGIENQYEDLRAEYEDLRRPFSVTAQDQYTDVWEFPTVKHYPGKHPCEKPLAMIEYMIQVSSRPGALVADFFCGSGVTAKAAVKLNRHYFCCDISPNYAEKARLEMAQLTFLAK